MQPARSRFRSVRMDPAPSSSGAGTDPDRPETSTGSRVGFPEPRAIASQIAAELTPALRAMIAQEVEDQLARRQERAIQSDSPRGKRRANTPTGSVRRGQRGRHQGQDRGTAAPSGGTRIQQSQPQQHRGSRQGGSYQQRPQQHGGSHQAGSSRTAVGGSGRCTRCGYTHVGPCWPDGCFYCGQPGHLKRDCPALGRGPGGGRVRPAQARSGRGRRRSRSSSGGSQTGQSGSTGTSTSAASSEEQLRQQTQMLMLPDATAEDDPAAGAGIVHLFSISHELFPSRADRYLIVLHVCVTLI